MKRAAAILALILAVLPSVRVDSVAQPPERERLTLKRAFMQPSLRGAVPQGYAWSRDDRKLAYLWNEQGWSFREVWVVDLATGERRRVTDFESRELAEAREANAELKAEERKTEDELIQEVHRRAGAGRPAWGPDGALYVPWQGDIWRLPSHLLDPQTRETACCAEPELFLDLGDGIGEFQFSADGQKLAFSCRNAFWVLELASGTLREAAQGAGGLSQGSWNLSPDGRFIAFVRTDSGGVRKVNVVDYLAENVQSWGVDRPRPGDTIERSFVGIVDLARSGWKRNEPRLLKLAESAEVYVDCLSWSPSGKHLLVGLLSKDTKTYELYLAEATSGRSALIQRETDEKWFNARGSAQWLGDSCVVFPSERDGWNHLYKLDLSSWQFPPLQVKEGIATAVETGEAAAGGKDCTQEAGAEEAEEAPPDGLAKPFTPALPEPTQLTHGEWEVTEVYIPRQATAIYCVTSERGSDRRDIYAVNPDGTGFRRLTTGTGVNTFAAWQPVRGGAVSWEETRAVVSAATALRGPFHYVLDLGSGRRLATITGDHPPEFYRQRWMEPEFHRIASEHDGAAVAVRLYRPPYAASDERRPLVIYVHGAGYAQTCLQEFQWLDPVSIYLADTLGYLVADVDYRGSSGYGRKWRTDVFQRLGELEVADCVSVANHFLASGEADPQRVGIWGWSYGGFLTNMALFTAPETFQVGGSVAAVNGWRNYHTWFATQRLGDPAENAESYKKSSPIEHCAGLQGRLLMIHGIRDDNVFFQDFAQLAHKLGEAGKHFDAAVYPEAGHGPASDENMVHIAETVCGYFERWFGLGPGAPGPAPEDMLEWKGQTAD